MSRDVCLRCVLALVFTAFVFLPYHSLGLERFKPATPVQLSFDHLTRENGLPSNTVLCAIQDFTGYIWIGTTNGLVRYDGHDMKIFRLVPGDSSSLQDNTIVTLCQASDSLIWIGTVTGWSIYNPNTRELKNFPFPSGRNTGPYQMTRISSFFEMDGGGILIATSKGIIRTRPDGSFSGLMQVNQCENPHERAYVLNSISSILPAPGKPGKFFFGTGGGLILYDTLTRKAEQDYRWPRGASNMIKEIYPDLKNRFWVCGWGMGISCFDLNTESWQYYCPFKPGLTTLNFVPKGKDEFWVMTDSYGLGIFSKITHKFTFYRHDPRNSKSISSNVLLGGAYFNGRRDFWIWSSAGIDIRNPEYFSFRQVKVPYKWAWISDFYKDPVTGKLFIGAYQCNGLPVHDTRKQTWSLLRCDFPVSYPGFSVNGFYCDRQGRLWVSTRSNLCYYDPPENRIKLFRMPGGKPLSLSEDPVVYGLNEDAAGNLWVGTRFDGVVRISPGRNHADYFRHVPGNPGSLIEGTHFLSILEDRFGRVWFGCRNGVSIFNPSTGRFDNSLMDTLRKYGLKERWVNGMVKDSLGRIWLAIDKAGLVRVDIRKNGYFGIKIFHSGNGMNDPSTGWIGKDNFSNFWVLNAGLLHVDPYAERFTLIDDKNGLHDLPDWSARMYFDAAANIYIGDSVGYETRNIREIRFAGTAPLKLVLESVEINGKDMKGRIFGKDHAILELVADKNNLVFHYTAISFHLTGKEHYRYWLKGNDHDWTEAEFSREARYTNLPPGRYEFMVEASNGGGWQKCSETIHIRIHPFFWQTWWFILTCILSLLALLALIYRYRVNQLLKVERMRTRIATDLHDDVSSTLSSISILSEILATQAAGRQSAGMISEIGSNARDMLERIDDIIWSVNPRNDKFQDLGLRIREYAIPLFESKNIRFTIEIPDSLYNLSLPMEVRRNIYLIAKESVNNLVKYAGCSNAIVLFRMERSILLMEITDDGAGFDPAKPTARNGLRNMKSRAEKISGQLKITSSPGKGTSVCLETGF